MLTGMWVSPTRYLVTDAERDRSEVITILATAEETDDFANCLELEHLAREEVEQGWDREEKEGKRPYTPDEKRDLGGVLSQIKKSRQHRRETGHSRWWLPASN